MKERKAKADVKEMFRVLDKLEKKEDSVKLAKKDINILRRYFQINIYHFLQRNVI